MPIFPWPVCPLAGHARLGQHVVAGSMMSLLEWLCWRAYQEGVCLNPHFHCKRTSPRLSVELPSSSTRGFCHGIPSLFLPVSVGRPGVAVRHAPCPMAKRPRHVSDDTPTPTAKA